MQAMEMKKTQHKILVRYSSEVALKGKKAKGQLAEILRKNILKQAQACDSSAKVIRRFNYLEIQTSYQNEVTSLLKRIFGIGTISCVLAETHKGLDYIVQLGKATFADTVAHKTFAVIVKTTGFKDFASQTLREKLGAMLLPYSRGVDLKDPQQECRVDLINGIAYLSLNRIKGQGGFPIGSQGVAIVLISGGFDSSVAAWMLMKRGVLCHLVFCNLAGKAYQRLVLQVAKVLVDQWGGVQEQKFITVSFERVLEDIIKNVKDSYRQVILKRKMLQAAEYFAREYRADAIVTGEALSQVSSQTLKNLRTIGDVTHLPILRPLIGMNKQEIIDLSYKVGTGLLSEHVKERCHITRVLPTLAAIPKETQIQENQTDSTLLQISLSSSQTYNLDKLDLSKLRENSLFKLNITENDHIIDCQPKHLYKAHHFVGALHIEFDEIHTKFKLLNPKDSYLIYCTYGTQSAIAAEQLQQMGFEAYAFSGGIHNLKKRYPKKMTYQ